MAKNCALEVSPCKCRRGREVEVEVGSKFDEEWVLGFIEYLAMVWVIVSVRVGQG